MTAQAQLTLDGQPDPPQIGEWLRCKESKRWAQVYGIGQLGKRSPLLGFPIYVGDVVMEWSVGYHRITSGGAFFWTKWERVDLDDASRVALEEAQRGGPEP